MPGAAQKLKPTETPDPKREILDRIGDISEIEIAQNEVLIAIFQRSETTAGGIILTAKTLKEDEYQGKVGLVLKFGGACRFERTDPNTGIKYGIPVAVGDWVVTRPSDTWRLDINANPGALEQKDFVWCRLVYDDQIRLKIPSPMMVW
jgi:hypothetical protein